MDDSKKLDLILERLDGLTQRVQTIEDKDAKKAEALASSQEKAKPVAQEAAAATEEVEKISEADAEITFFTKGTPTAIAAHKAVQRLRASAPWRFALETPENMN